MVSYFNVFRGINLLSVSLRLVLAFLCGGIIGLERELKRRPAGFRTHILICLGASMTTLTSQYLYLVMHYQTDMARLGAQVVAGIGFIGAGTIIVTRHQRVKGLTTAAGLWAAAIIGLALGAGFYEGGLAATVMVVLAEMYFSKMEYRILRSAPEMNFYIEYDTPDSLHKMLEVYREQGVKILDMEITRADGNESFNCCAIFSLRFHKNCPPEKTMSALLALKGVEVVQEL